MWSFFMEIFFFLSTFLAQQDKLIDIMQHNWNIPSVSRVSCPMPLIILRWSSIYLKILVLIATEKKNLFFFTVKRQLLTVLPLIISAGIINLLPFFLRELLERKNNWRVGIISGIKRLTKGPKNTKILLLSFQCGIYSR